MPEYQHPRETRLMAVKSSYASPGQRLACHRHDLPTRSTLAKATFTLAPSRPPASYCRSPAIPLDIGHMPVSAERYANGLHRDRSKAGFRAGARLRAKGTLR